MQIRSSEEDNFGQDVGRVGGLVSAFSTIIVPGSHIWPQGALAFDRVFVHPFLHKDGREFDPKLK